MLVDITPRVDRTGVEKIKAFMSAHARDGFATVAEAADAVAAYLPHRPRPRSQEGLKKNLRLHADGRWRWHWDPRFIEGPRSVAGSRLDGEDHVVAMARLLTQPTLLVRGGSSEVVQEAHAREFLQLVPHAEYLDVTGARHMVAGDRNDQFSASILDFLAPAAASRAQLNGNSVTSECHYGALPLPQAANVWHLPPWRRSRRPNMFRARLC